MKTLSVDLRERILAAYDANEGTRDEVAHRFRVSLGMIKKLLQQRRRTGDIAPRHHFSGRKPKILDRHRRRLRRLACSLPAIHYVLADLGLTYKKTLRASEQDRADIAAAREQWRKEFAQAASGSLVFLDESAAKTNMTRLRGRAPRGQRVHDHAPAGHWCATTMIGAIRLAGSTACMTIEDATDTEVFRAFVQQVLIPTLKPGDVVVMDNLSSHKKPVRRLEQSGMHVRFLPPYSPDFNPIEKMWSKVKTALRAAKARAAALNDAIADALAAITPEDAAGWFASCGYCII
jgi:transposase